MEGLTNQLEKVQVHILSGTAWLSLPLPLPANDVHQKKNPTNFELNHSKQISV